MRFLLASLLLASTTAILPAQAADMTLDAINAADPAEAGDGQSAAMIKLQVLLDRAGASPVVVDGYPGQNTTVAIKAFETMQGLEADGEVDQKVVDALKSANGDPIAKTYTLTEEDVSQKLVDIADDPTGEALSKLDCLCYTRISEAIAERFHMDEDLLLKLNDGADFSKAGTEIAVVDPGAPVEAAVARIEVDKAGEVLRAYGEDDKLVFAARTTVGSEETPSPSGTVKVNAVAAEPTYTWNAKKNLSGDSSETYQIAAGPNGPVGGTWIDLSEPTFGIHGTPDPSEIGRAESHGCVRLTNWDAAELAQIVSPGVEVKFLD